MRETYEQQYERLRKQVIMGRKNGKIPPFLRSLNDHELVIIAIRLEELGDT